MTDTAFEVHGLLYLLFFGGGVLLAMVSGFIFLGQWFFGGNREKAMNRASKRGLVAIVLMLTGFLFADRALTKTDEDGFIIEVEPEEEEPPLLPPTPAVYLS